MGGGWDEGRLAAGPEVAAPAPALPSRLGVARPPRRKAAGPFLQKRVRGGACRGAALFLALRLQPLGTQATEGTRAGDLCPQEGPGPLAPGTCVGTRLPSGAGGEAPCVFPGAAVTDDPHSGVGQQKCARSQHGGQSPVSSEACGKKRPHLLQPLEALSAPVSCLPYRGLCLLFHWPSPGLCLLLFSYEGSCHWSQGPLIQGHSSRGFFFFL